MELTFGAAGGACQLHTPAIDGFGATDLGTSARFQKFWGLSLPFSHGVRMGEGICVFLW